MNYVLDSYANVNFDEERQRIISASKRKLELDNQHKKLDREIRLRFMVLKYRFLRSSTKVKTDFFMAVLENMNVKDVIAFLYYLNLNMLKIGKYADALETDFIKDRILIDHNRSMDPINLKESYQEDVQWMSTIGGNRQLGIIFKLLGNCGNGIGRKIIIPLLRLYHYKLKTEGLRTKIQFSEYNISENINDAERYTAKQSMEVDKLRNKWNEVITKYKKEVENMRDILFPGRHKKLEDPTSDEKKTNKKGKTDKTERKTKEKKPKGKVQEVYLDWLQLLPIWVVKKIFNYLDQKTLNDIKKLNAYWKYASDSVLKERKAIASMRATIEKMKAKIDPKLLEETEEIVSKPARKLPGPATRRLNRLETRGATHSKIKVLPKTKNFTVNTISITEDLKEEAEEFAYPVYRMALFPRFVRDDVVLYRNYRSPLKDINIIIDLEEDMKQYRRTLSYSLSSKLSDTLSFSEMDQSDLEGW